jgi:putative DNA primase/helicase
MEKAAELFYDRHFDDKKDENMNLIGFENGVLDLSTCTFRKGEPSDYITMSCKYDFKVYTRFDDPELEEVMAFWVKVFVEEDVREFWLDQCGKILKGGNTDQMFTILQGKGANGKSAALDLLAQTLGEYYGSFPTTLLTGNEADSNSCTPELLRSKGRRLMSISEPDGSQRVNTGILKRLTAGNEVIYARGLHKEGIDFRPQFKLFYICNQDPKLPSDDYGTWRRILKVPFVSTFKMEGWLVPQSWKEQLQQKVFFANKNFSERIPHLRQAMMWLLFQSYKRVVGRRAQPPLPPVVTRAIDDYKLSQDFLLRFVRQMCRPEPGAYLSLNDFYTQFKAWWSEEFGRAPLPSRDAVRLEMCNKPGWQMMVNNRWPNWRLKKLEDEVKENEAAVVAQQVQDEEVVEEEAEEMADES